MIRSVGVRQLKNHTSAVLRQVKCGDPLIISHRKRPIAVLLPLRGVSHDPQLLQELVRVGRISWSGGKPAGCRRAPTVRGASVAKAVLEDRR